MRVDIEKIRTLLDVLIKAEYEFVTTDNLFATDRPDLVADPEKVMFKINFTDIITTIRELISSISELEKLGDIRKENLEEQKAYICR